MLATQSFEAGPFSIEMVKMAHSIPDSFAVALTCELGTTLVTGDYKFDQTPVDGVPADVARLAELGRDGLLLLCGDSTNADAPACRCRSRAWGPKLEEVFARCQGRIVVTCFASNIHRVQQVVDAAAVLGRKVSLVGRSMRKNVNIGRMLGHIDVPEGMLVGPKEIEEVFERIEHHAVFAAVDAALQDGGFFVLLGRDARDGGAAAKTLHQDVIRDDVELLLRLAVHICGTIFAQHIFDARAAHLCRDCLGGQRQGGQHPGEVACGALVLRFSLQDVRLQRGDVQSGDYRAFGPAVKDSIFRPIMAG